MHGRSGPSRFHRGPRFHRSPVHLLQHSEDAVYRETQGMLRACGRGSNVGVCCINMDAATPDANVKALFHAARDYSKELTCT